MMLPAHTSSITSLARRFAFVALAAAVCVVAGGAVSADNWPEWRGPRRDGRSTETGLPAKWSLPAPGQTAGQNLAWRVPIGSRSAPVVFGDRVYLYAPAGPEELRQERLVALDAASGKTLWEQHFSVYLTDIPAHRVAWASPSVDPGHRATSTRSAAMPRCGRFHPDGKLLWERGLVEDFGAITTHGGRSPSPVVDGDLVVVNALISALGHARARRQPLLRVRQEDRRRRSGSARRSSGTGTPTTPRRSWPRSTARACSSSAAPTASSTR